MPPPKGHPKWGGRPKGGKNKSTRAVVQRNIEKSDKLIEVLKELNYDPARAVWALLPELEPRDQATVHLKLMEYIYPKIRPLEPTDKADTVQVVVVDYTKPNEA